MCRYLRVGSADITQAEHIQKRFTIVRYERERNARGVLFFQRGNAEDILSLDYNQDDPREGEGLRIKDATVSNKEVAV